MKYLVLCIASLLAVFTASADKAEASSLAEWSQSPQVLAEVMSRSSLSKVRQQRVVERTYCPVAEVMTFTSIPGEGKHGGNLTMANRECPTAQLTGYYVVQSVLTKSAHVASELEVAGVEVFELKPGAGSHSPVDIVLVQDLETKRDVWSHVRF